MFSVDVPLHIGNGKLYNLHEKCVSFDMKKNGRKEKEKKIWRKKLYFVVNEKL